MIKRLKIPKENRMFQRCFDHWVFWIKVKRVMKYHLRFSNLMVKPVKCDIRWAFDKWRRGDMINANRLSRMDYNKLQVINIDQSKGLDKLAENEASNSVTINLLNT
jgi:antirestriction protein